MRYDRSTLRARGHDLDGLVELPSIADPAARRASFRQALTNLARGALTWGPSPLEGLAPHVLARSVRTALNAGLFDDLDWLSPTAASVALYELGNALPAGLEKRELGRRVLSHMNEGTADVFAAIAARMARASKKPLTGASIRARVSLVFAAPPQSVDAGALAFALVSRRELAREWIAAPSTGSLPARRLAARILERAAVVAVRRAFEGDDYAPRVFSTETLAPVFQRLLSDREPLVWRHAAVARGLLAGVASPHWKAVHEALHPRLTPTEWRRAAVSLVAAIATDPERALPRAKDLITSTIAAHDRGLVSTMVWGLPRALDAEPEAAESLLDAIVDIDANGAAAGIAAVLRELSGDPGKRAVATARAILADRLAATDDESERLLVSAFANDLTMPSEMGSAPDVREHVARALALFSEKSARDAYGSALLALEAARAAMSTLEAAPQGSGDASTLGRVLSLRDLDVGLLEDSTLADLLQLGGKADEARASVEDLQQRLGRWLLDHERLSPARERIATETSGRRLRALLHLLDSSGAQGDEDALASVVHARRMEAATLLFSRLAGDGRSSLHRTLSATLARALDGLVRDGGCEPVDVLLVTAARLDDPSDVTTLAEASMDPDVEAALRAYARFMRSASEEEPVPLATRASRPPSEPPSRIAERVATPLAARIEPLLELGAALGDDGSGRAEGLRALLVRIARALQTIASAKARSALENASAAFDALASAAHGYAQLEVGAQLRVLGESQDEAPASSVAVAQANKLTALLARASERDYEEAASGVREGVADLRRLLPPSITRIVSEVLEHAVKLPWEAAAQETSTLVVDEQLPAWLGPRRTIGGFYLVRTLGGGGAASVFVAKRIEERHDTHAECFALKVPDYDGAAARALSEREFLEYFRAEATALLGMPASPNLARFVTFDLGARPKPILVMELIDGPTLERFIAAESAREVHKAGRAFEILDGVLAGLEVMHGHAIGHLDLKPSNVILRHGETPTLVDFGLAGRVLRPGCATGPYGAPEIWGVLPDDFTGDPSPMPADIYAFGALAYEVLTGHTLFDAPSEVAIVSKHLVHDGHPEELDRLGNVRPLVELLEHTLRRDPRKRWKAPQVRAALRAIAKVASDFPWPLGA